MNFFQSTLYLLLYASKRSSHYYSYVEWQCESVDHLNIQLQMKTICKLSCRIENFQSSTNLYQPFSFIICCFCLSKLTWNEEKRTLNKNAFVYFVVQMNLKEEKKSWSFYYDFFIWFCKKNMLIWCRFDFCLLIFNIPCRDLNLMHILIILFPIVFLKLKKKFPKNLQMSLK